MAKRNQRATTAKAGIPPAEEAVVDARSEAMEHEEHLIVFRIAGESFGFRLSDVGQIVRLPALAHMPFGPKSLRGLANLRGVVLPVVDTSCLLGLPDGASSQTARLIVIDRGAPVAFLVAGIEELLTLPSAQVETDDAGAGSIDPAFLEGIVKGAEGKGTIKVLNPQRLLKDEFSRLGVSGSRGATQVAVSTLTSQNTAPDQRRNCA
jgi:purine-binding chemotaxis protein CheW